MDFAEILNRWENRERRGKRPARMADWLERYPPAAAGGRIEDGREAGRGQASGLQRGRSEALRRMKPQEELDLHGLTTAEALQATERFLAACRSRGLEKVLIIHGKGNHSRGEPVLGKAVRRCLERSPHAGAFGAAEQKRGGRGALWVILRQRSR